MNQNNYHLNNGGELKIWYICPMCPGVRQDKPGMCPNCGMALVPERKKIKKQEPCPAHGMMNVHEKHKKYDKHAGHSMQMFAKRFWISLVLTLPVVLYSEIFKMVFRLNLPEIPYSQFIIFIFSSIVFFYGGWIFLLGAFKELRGRVPGMMTLIALAISAAYIYSVFGIFQRDSHTLFWELTTLITIMLLGHWIEMRAVQGAQGALKELSKLLPDKAEVIRDGKSEIISLSELKEGDFVFVRPGGKIPADGIILEGKSEISESMITGESKPVWKLENNEVIAGTVNGDGSLKIKVTKIGEHTFLAGVMKLVREAQASKSHLQILSDKAAFVLTIVAVLASVATFILWLVFSNMGIGFAIERLVAVLVVACPHALGLAIPLVASISTTLAARNGFLVRERLALELARKVNVVLFDKTGTLTKGEYGVSEIIKNGSSEISENEVLQIAATADSHSEHFIARAIVEEARKKDLEILELKNFERLPGKGVRGVIAGQTILVGGEAILDDGKIVPEVIKNKIKKFANEGKTIIYVLKNGNLLGILALADIIREESKEAIKQLKSAGIKIAMITGDSEEVAKWAANELGIEEYFSKVLPQEKSEKVKILQKKGNKVAMVGDGINDAPALTQADLGIAIGAGTNVAIESAGIVLVKNDPLDIPKIIKLSRLTYNKMVQNLFWATGYNVIALPLAAGALASRGILLQPALAALFMSLSTVIVAINAVFLRKTVL